MVQRLPIRRGPSFAIDLVDSDARSARLRARGRLVAAAADMISAVLTAQQERGVRYVRVDVSEVTAADSRGLNALLDVHRRFLAGRGTLIFTGVGNELRATLAVAGLDRILFTTEPTAEASLPSLAR
jgi:anti-anti-sigma factor